jgi:hypothetical protein
MAEKSPSRQCRSCGHFRNDAKYLETAFWGLTSLSSGFGSARSDDGICLRHDRYLSARSSCPDFLPAAPSGQQTPLCGDIRATTWPSRPHRNDGRTRNKTGSE